MTSEQPATGQKRVPQTPADKTDAPRRVRQQSVRLLETSEYICVEPATPLSEVVERMKRARGGYAVVCRNERIAGIFTEHDLLNKIICEEVDMNTPVGDWMTTDVQTLAADATIGDAVRVMNERNCRNIPLIEGDKLVGLVSVFDVITFLAETYPKETMNLPPVPAQVMDTQEGG